MPCALDQARRSWHLHCCLPAPRTGGHIFLFKLLRVQGCHPGCLRKLAGTAGSDHDHDSDTAISPGPCITVSVPALALRLGPCSRALVSPSPGALWFTAEIYSWPWAGDRARLDWHESCLPQSGNKGGREQSPGAGRWQQAGRRGRRPAESGASTARPLEDPFIS